METENIKKYLETAYSDEKLAALLAHCEDGLLVWDSCCCLIGIPTAPHALRSWEDFFYAPAWESDHLREARSLPFAREAEREFLWLGKNKEESRELLLPLIREELQVRELNRYLREHSVTGELALESIEREGVDV